MNMQDVILLRTPTMTQDAYGVPHATYEEREVYAKVESVTAQEFFNGGQNGFKPEYRFIVNAWEYSDEPEVVYKGSVYSVYRVYRRSLDRAELYAERKAGVHGSGTTDQGTA